MKNDYFLNNDVLIQIEFEFTNNYNGEYKIVTFFRHSHKVNITNGYKDYNTIKGLFLDMIANLYEL